MYKKILGLASDSVIYGLSGSLSRLVGFVLLPFLTKYLSPSEYGVIYMLGIVSIIFIPLANLGMTNAIFRRFNENKTPEARAKVLSTGLVSILISSISVLVISLLFAGQIAKYVIGDEATTDLVRMSLVTATFSSIGAAFFVALRAGRRVRTAASINLARVVITSTLSLWFVIGMGQGVRGMVLASLISEPLLVCGNFLLIARGFRFYFDLELWKRMLSYGIPFTPHQVQMAMVEMFGTYMVREMIGIEATGLYGTAARFAAPVSLVVSSVQTSWVPYKFEMQTNDPNPKAFFQSVMVYYIAGLSYLWLGAAIWGPEVLRLLTTSKFHAAAPLIWATTLIPVAQGIYFMSGTGIELGNNTRLMPVVTFLGMVTVIVSAFLLVGPLGALGAALATILSRLAMAGLMYFFSQRQFPIAYDWPTLTALAAATLPFLVVTYSLQSQPLAIRLGVITLASLLYPVIAVMILLRSRNERSRVRYLLAKLRLA